jgi:hypothetical protein
MPSFIVKAAKGVDLYLIWSTLNDCATHVGTRDEIRKHLWAEYHREHPECLHKAGTSPSAGLDRADARGTSAIEPAGIYGWGDEAFHVAGGAPMDGRRYELPREHLADYARALLADDNEAARALLRAVPDA